MATCDYDGCSAPADWRIWDSDRTAHACNDHVGDVADSFDIRTVSVADLRVQRAD